MTIDIKLLPKQAEALKKLTDDKTTEILFGGSVFSGKSVLICFYSIYMCLTYKGLRGGIARTKLTQLRLTTQKTLHEVFNMMGLKSDIHYKFNGMTNTYTFNNGSELILLNCEYMPSDPVFDRFGSLELSFLCIDELAQVSFKAYSVLKSRIRYKLKEYNLKPKTLSTTNPSSNWIYDYFYLPYTKDTIEDYKCFIPALPTDNPYMTEDYYNELLKLPTPTKKRLLDGDWDYDTDDDALFSPNDLYACFNNELEEGKLYISADIAGHNMGDDTCLILWNHLNVIDIKIFNNKTIKELIDYIKKWKKEYNIPNRNVICDNDGIGYSLSSLIPGSYAFHANNKPLGKDNNYQNLKSQCYYTLSDRVKNGLINFGDMNTELKERLVKELVAHKMVDTDKDNKFKITPKEIIKKNIGSSPDIADAIMMRMVYELKQSEGLKLRVIK